MNNIINSLTIKPNKSKPKTKKKINIKKLNNLSSKSKKNIVFVPVGKTNDDHNNDDQIDNNQNEKIDTVKKQPSDNYKYLNKYTMDELKKIIEQNHTKYPNQVYGKYKSLNKDGLITYIKDYNMKI